LDTEKQTLHGITPKYAPPDAALRELEKLTAKAPRTPREEESRNKKSA
jgi:hypothetical protein